MPLGMASKSFNTEKPVVVSAETAPKTAFTNVHSGINKKIGTLANTQQKIQLKKVRINASRMLKEIAPFW
jgi:hypothetical protein